jgi:hypothetical protein
MNVTYSTAAMFAAGAVMTLAMSAQPTAQAQPSPTTAAPQEQQVTVVGCVVRESEYRRARDAGKGGVAGTGVGVGNEFVLTNASMAKTAESPVATAGTTTSTAYELTGSNEKQAEQFVGRRVEITGKLKAAEVGAAGPTGGPTAGKPPSGVDVTSKDLKLRELEIATVRETTGTCAAQ